MVVQDNVPVYQINKLTFILQEKIIVIKTSFNQAFYLIPNGYWTSRFTRNRLSLIREMIKLGEIRDLNELAGYTRPGLHWTGSCIDYDITNCKVIKL